MRSPKACICYSGDLTDPKETKFTLDYYLRLAKQLEKRRGRTCCASKTWPAY